MPLSCGLAGSSGGGGGVNGSALTPGPSAALDTAALTAQLSRLDAASLEAIRGYASGYIDGRVQAMPQYGQVCVCVWVGG